jgi:hypothetical protein
VGEAGTDPCLTDYLKVSIVEKIKKLEDRFLIFTLEKKKDNGLMFV